MSSGSILSKTMAQSPKIIYGTAWKKERTTALVIKAVLNGFRAIDTACQPKHYREDLVGAAIKELQSVHRIPRKDLFLQTKFTPIGGQDLSQPLPYDPTDPIPTQILSSYQKSLENLGTSYIDSYVLQSPFPKLSETIEAWNTLIKLQDEGKVGLIGISNAYDVKTLESMGKVRKVQVVQNRWYEGNSWDAKVLNYCKESGIMYQSFWTLSGSPNLLSHPSVIALARVKNVTEAQVVYKVARSLGVIPLSGTTKPTHMEEDLAVENLSFEKTISKRC